MNTKIITVSQLNFYIKSLFDQDRNLQFVLVEGEISNFKDHYSSGHAYFSLKDNKSVIGAVMFSFFKKNLRFRPENGMKVIVRARVNVYEPTGQYQLYVEDMQPDGVGALTVQLEQLKKKLEAEGLFSPEHKKPLPKYPETVGVITSPTGAAVRDILNILGRRFPLSQVVLAPVLVQGDAAYRSLTDAVNLFSAYRCADVLIIGRGGGSMEDLWAFNHEELVRAIYRCPIPVISAVGHETDFTLCDFVADLRAPTPSAAAELCVPDSAELIENLDAIRQYADSLIDNLIRKETDSLQKQIQLCAAYSPAHMLKLYEERLCVLADRASSAAEQTYTESLKSVSENISKVDALNPVAVLKRGFSYLTKDGVNISSVSDVKTGDRIHIRFSDGEKQARIIENDLSQS